MAVRRAAIRSLIASCSSRVLDTAAVDAQQLLPPAEAEGPDLVAVTVREVAARAGVCPKTVSNVLNGTARVADPTRRRVMNAVVLLGYRPNHQARALRSGRTDVIALAVPDRLGPVDAAFTGAIMSAAEQRSLGVLIVRLTALVTDAAALLRCAEGVILRSDPGDEEWRAVRVDLPSVVVRVSESDDWPSYGKRAVDAVADVLGRSRPGVADFPTVVIDPPAVSSEQHGPTGLHHVPAPMPAVAVAVAVAPQSDAVGIEPPRRRGREWREVGTERVPRARVRTTS